MRVWRPPPSSRPGGRGSACLRWCFRRSRRPERCASPSRPWRRSGLHERQWTTCLDLRATGTRPVARRLKGRGVAARSGAGGPAGVPAILGVRPTWRGDTLRWKALASQRGTAWEVSACIAGNTGCKRGDRPQVAAGATDTRGSVQSAVGSGGAGMPCCAVRCHGMAWLVMDARPTLPKRGKRIKQLDRT